MNLVACKDGRCRYCMQCTEIAELKSLLATLEWAGQSLSEMISPECPSCGQPETVGHTGKCKLAAALRSTSAPTKGEP